MSYVDFSSWPREQEQMFVVYEQQAADSQKRAWMISGIIAAVFFVFMVGVYAGITPKHNDLGKDMNMSNLTKKDNDKDKAKAEAPKAEAPKTEEPAAEAPKAEAPAAEAPKTE